MTERERFIACLERRPISGLVPHFELVFFLALEAFGTPSVEHIRFDRWDQMTERERELARHYVADSYIRVGEAFGWSALFVGAKHSSFEENRRLLELIREKTGNRFFLMLYGDPTFAIPGGGDMVDFSARMYEEPEKLKSEARRSVKGHLEWVERFTHYPGLLDGFAMCSDYCFNVNPFFSPTQFSEFVAPYLCDTIRAYRDMGFYAIKHTDGNIMPILDQLLQCNPHALHSLDPQGGVDLAEVKRVAGDRVCLIGNVNCALLQTGTEEQVVSDCRRALRDGMPGGGFIFSTSNCIYTGMPFERYELMLKVWREYGVYQ